MALVKVNTDFVNERVAKMKDSIEIQDKLFTDLEAKYKDTRMKAKEKTRWVKTDINDIDALLAFLRNVKKKMYDHEDVTSPAHLQSSV